MYLNSSWIIDLNKSVRYWDLLHDIKYRLDTEVYMIGSDTFNMPVTWVHNYHVNFEYLHVRHSLIDSTITYNVCRSFRSMWHIEL